MKMQLTIGFISNKTIIVLAEEACLRDLMTAIKAAVLEESDVLISPNDYMHDDDPLPQEIWIKPTLVEVLILNNVSNIRTPKKDLLIPAGNVPVA
ncbi:hypothetical protein LCGC14_2962310 [marine sediment metagenome]|uniref:Uncharacterized protein n=1 Tax=marine sediment metagenome TaxID=412755 RepID=A0A0F9A361_9ZZZZ